MKSKEKDNIIVIRFFPDEDLHKKLIEACKIHKVNNAVLISGLGQLKKFKLGFFKGNGFYNIERFVEPHELLSLNGNIYKQNGFYKIHLHAVLSNEKNNAIGGHLIDGKVEVTNEIVLLKCTINLFDLFKKNLTIVGD